MLLEPLMDRTQLHRSNARPATTAPKTDNPPRIADAAFVGVADADALTLAADAGTEAADDTDAVAALDGAVMMAVGNFPVAVVGAATIMPPGAVEALTVVLLAEGASSWSPVEKTVQACLPPPTVYHFVSISYSPLHCIKKCMSCPSVYTYNAHSATPYTSYRTAEH